MTSKELLYVEDALNESLNIQNKLYNLMAEKGWYQTETADQNKINKTKQKNLNN